MNNWCKWTRAINACGLKSQPAIRNGIIDHARENLTLLAIASLTHGSQFIVIVEQEYISIEDFVYIGHHINVITNSMNVNCESENL